MSVHRKKCTECACVDNDVTGGEPSSAHGCRTHTLLLELNAELLSHDSATAVLQAWCDAHMGLGREGGFKIVARRVRDVEKPLPEAGQAVLGVGDDDPVRYRRVCLAYGDHVLSEADNWYLPNHLSPEQNVQLEATEIPFGVVVRSLNFCRRTLSSRVFHTASLSSCSGASDDAISPAPPTTPAHVMQHTAVLSTSQGHPFSYLVETYTGEALAVALPKGA